MSERADRSEPEVEGRPAKPDEDERASRRERWLRLALMTVGAALIASIFGLLGQQSNDPSSAAEATAETEQGVSLVSIEVSDGGGDGRVEATTRFAADAYDTELSIAGDGEGYSSSADVQRFVSVDGVGYYRPAADGDWTNVDGPGAVDLSGFPGLSPTVIGRSAAGLSSLIEALELTDATDGGVHSGTATVAALQAIEDLPAGLATLVDPAWGWSDEQPVELSVTVDGGRLTGLEATATASAEDRTDGALAMSTTADWSELGTEITVEAPAVG